VKHTVTLTITLDNEASPGWPLTVYADTGDPRGPFPISQGGLTLHSAMWSGEAVTSLILDVAKSKGIKIEEV
jgi:hypothetical protein